MSTPKKHASAMNEMVLARKREALAREKAGIRRLQDGEELIDHATFARMHQELAMGRETWADDDSMSDSTADEELLLEEIATELPAQSSSAALQAATSTPPRDSAEVADLEQMLLAAKSRDDVAELALRIARHYARAAALFVVNRDVIAGLRGSGEGLDERFDGIMISTNAESVVAEPLTTRKLARICTPARGLDKRLLRALGRDDAIDIIVIPVFIGQRVVNLLYADNGPDPVAETSIGALRVLCSGITLAYERVIRKRKQVPAGGQPKL